MAPECPAPSTLCPGGREILWAQGGILQSLMNAPEQTESSWRAPCQRRFAEDKANKLLLLLLRCGLTFCAFGTSPCSLPIALCPLHTLAPQLLTAEQEASSAALIRLSLYEC